MQPNLSQIATSLDLKLLTSANSLAAIHPEGVYTSDLLSCVMAAARSNAIWVTLQAHANIIAVAALLELSAIIITEAAQPEPATLEKAAEQGVVLLSTPRSTFEICGRLWEFGFRPPLK